MEMHAIQSKASIHEFRLYLSAIRKLNWTPFVRRPMIFIIGSYCTVAKRIIRRNLDHQKV